jgi:hypothetical protein
VPPDDKGHGSSTIWTGWDPRSGVSEEAVAPAVTFVSQLGTGYELLAVAGRGFRPPKFLSVVGADSHAQSDMTEVDATLRKVWSLEYRQLVETGPSNTDPYAIYLLGVNPPDDASELELAEFNDFYSNVHLPEVAERRHALRAVRYELAGTLKAPYQGAPTYLAAYEVDEAGAADLRHTGPPYSRGPDVWQRHSTPWRLWFRLRST